jgi:tetratricopeptide (TPR) repeat protein
MKGKKPEAIAEYEEILRHWPDSAQAHYYLALLLADARRSAEAANHLRQALDAARRDGNRDFAEQIQRAIESDPSGKRRGSPRSD